MKTGVIRLGGEACVRWRCSGKSSSVVLPYKVMRSIFNGLQLPLNLLK